MIGPHGNCQVPLFPLDPYPFPEGFLRAYNMVTAEALWTACYGLVAL
jgi:hypothetical protein